MAISGAFTDELIFIANMGRLRGLTVRELHRVQRAIPEDSKTARRIRRELHRRDQLRSR